MAVTITEESASHIKKVKFSWTSAADGTASGTTSGVYTGKIERLVTVPGTSTSAPTDDYDIVITDEDSVDVLAGAGANRDTANTEQVASTSLGIVANDTLTLSVTNSGNAKSGTVYLYIK